MKIRKYVFGMGSGCCGTSSLSVLLNEQPRAFVGHELAPTLPWQATREAVQEFTVFKWNQLNHQGSLFDLVGDVGTYYLPYVRFLMHQYNLALKDECEFKFIILKRDKEETIQAFLDKFKRQNNNPLQNNKSPGQFADSWDASFPKYEGVSLREATSMYYDDYYREAESLLNDFPNRVRLYMMNDLNSEEKVEELLRFSGFENPNVIINIKENQRAFAR